MSGMRVHSQLRQLHYSHGTVKLGDFLSDDTQAAQCLRTKWAEMQLLWDGPPPKLV